jgi:hypothetical protein
MALAVAYWSPGKVILCVTLVVSRRSDLLESKPPPLSIRRLRSFLRRIIFDGSITGFSITII